MNELDIQALKEASHWDVGNDFIGYFEDVVMKDKLTDKQVHDLRMKGQFWFLMAYHKGRLGMDL